jgi:hypothetical protein
MQEDVDHYYQDLNDGSEEISVTRACVHASFGEIIVSCAKENQTITCCSNISVKIGSEQFEQTTHLIFGATLCILRWVRLGVTLIPQT